MIHIDTARPEELLLAFQLAFQHLSKELRAERVRNALALTTAGEINPDGVLVARDDKGLAGVQVAVPLAGANGLLWPPQTRVPDSALADRLVQAALTWLRERGVTCAQALLTMEETHLDEPLRRAGFRNIGALQYMVHHLLHVPAPTTKLHLQTYDQVDHLLFEQIVEQTYEGTLDCPELNGVRTVADILTGHQAQGKFDPKRWWLVWEREACASPLTPAPSPPQGRGEKSPAGENVVGTLRVPLSADGTRSVPATLPVGVVLLTQVPDGPAWDLSYLGVVPLARGRGLGKAMALEALAEARRARAPQLMLAVDARNTPALQLYRSVGFLPTQTRQIYLLVFERIVAG
ncbi:MAG: GNAT family N-acetyltransferase [Gemmataceae bacterium]|nr:GNAT family N-acetyltransferase [Gemmataceae bacterium]